MGQKINPIGFRLGVIKGWDSNWYGGKDFAEKLYEDQQIRKYVLARIPKGGIAKVIIERTLKRITLTIHTARPGVVIGKRVTKRSGHQIKSNPAGNGRASITDLRYYPGGDFVITGLSEKAGFTA